MLVPCNQDFGDSTIMMAILDQSDLMTSIRLGYDTSLDWDLDSSPNWIAIQTSASTQTWTQIHMIYQKTISCSWITLLTYSKMVTSLTMRKPMLMRQQIGTRGTMTFYETMSVVHDEIQMVGFQGRHVANIILFYVLKKHQ